MPAADWVGLEAVTYPGWHRVGMTDTVLWDERGRIGRAVQTLLIRAR